MIPAHSYPHNGHLVVWRLLAGVLREEGSLVGYSRWLAFQLE